MELAGVAAGGHLRSTLSDFDIKNAAEMEAHINMNAAAAKLNFDMYWANRFNDPTKVWRENRRRLDVKDILEVPACVLDISASKFDYSSIGPSYHEKRVEHERQREARKAGGEVSLMVHTKMIRDEDPYRLVIKGCDYTNVDKVVANLKDNTEVTHLSLANNGLEPDDCDALALLIASNRSIVSLDLSNNKIGGDGMSKIATALAANTSITDLDLGANGLSKSAAKALATALSSPTCVIARLQLSGNALGIYGTEELAAGLRGNTSVTTLGLQNNNVGNDGAAKLLDILPPKGLSIDEVVASAAAVATENGEKKAFNTSLVQISLEANRIDDPLLLSVTNGTWINDQVQMRHCIVKLEEEARVILTDVDAEWEALALLFQKATKELEERIAEEKAKALAAAPAPVPGTKGKAPTGKPGAKAPAAKPAARSASKSPEKAPAKAAPPAPAGSGKVKVAVGAGRNPSPKKSGK